MTVLQTGSPRGSRPLTLAVLCLISQALCAQSGAGPYVRLGMMRPKNEMNEQFEAGYRRHLAWHRSQRDPWAWYGWTVSFGERFGWFVDATFGRSASSLDSSVAPDADGQDFDANVTPYEEYMANSIYEFLPDVSDGGAAPPGTPLMELATFDLTPGTAPEFERALRGREAVGSGCRWYRLVAGGPRPRYIRLRPLASLAAAVLPPAGRNDDSLGPPGGVVRVSVEVLSFRPELSSGVGGPGAGQEKRR
jgi:hypothetical protein